MAHDHVHEHDPKTYYAEQVATIACCAALALVTCLWWARGMMFIVDRYHTLVFGGGIGLFVLVAIRAIAVWRSADGAAVAVDDGHDHAHEHEHGHEHEHDHGHDHDHDHDHAHAADHDHDQECGDGCGHSHGGAVLTHGHSHSHGHDHDHGWAPWRYIVLAVPVVLFFLKLPNDTFTSKDISGGLSGPAAEVEDKGYAPELSFKELEAAAQTPQTREENAGKTVQLTGKYMGTDDKRFSLTRFKMTCCSADAVPLNAAIMVDPASKETLNWKKLRNRWVRVTGQLQFLSRPKGDDPTKLEYMPAVIIYPKPGKPLSELVKIVDPPSNPFLN